MQYILLALTMKSDWEADEAVCNSIQLLKIFAASRASCTLAVGIASLASFGQQLMSSRGAIPQERSPGSCGDPSWGALPKSATRANSPHLVHTLVTWVLVLKLW